MLQRRITKKVHTLTGMYFIYREFQGCKRIPAYDY